jgi:hypothetical protein
VEITDDIHRFLSIPSLWWASKPLDWGIAGVIQETPMAIVHGWFTLFLSLHLDSDVTIIIIIIIIHLAGSIDCVQ